MKRLPLSSQVQSMWLNKAVRTYKWIVQSESWPEIAVSLRASKELRRQGHSRRLLPPVPVSGRYFGSSPTRSPQSLRSPKFHPAERDKQLLPASFEWLEIR